MSAPTQFTYDVFVSYSDADGQWVRDELWPQLEGAGLKISDYLEFELGVPKIVNIERAIEASRKVLLILTPDWLADDRRHSPAGMATNRGIILPHRCIRNARAPYGRIACAHGVRVLPTLGGHRPTSPASRANTRFAPTCDAGDEFVATQSAQSAPLIR